MSRIGARLDRLPTSRFHYRLLGLIGFGMFFDGFEIYMTSVVGVALVEAGWLTVSEIARFASAMFLGLALGALVAGRLGDLYGRKTMYQVNLLIYSIGALFCACAPNIETLLLLRVVTGFGLGAEIVIGYSMFAEFTPARSRGWWSGLLAVITNTAQPASAFAGRLIIPTLGWRWMFVVAGIPALFIWWYRRSLPESPRWYELHGREREAEQVMSAIETQIEAEHGKRLPPVVYRSAMTSAEAPVNASFWSLFQAGLLRRTLLGIALWIIGTTVVFAFTVWMPAIFVQRGLSMVRSFEFTSIMAVGAIPGTILGSFIADRWGRKWTLVGLALLQAALIVVYGQARAPEAVLLLGFCFVVVMNIQIALSAGVYTPELFPTKLRTSGVGLVNAAGRFTTILSPYLIGFLFTSFGEGAVFLTICSFLVLLALIVALLGVETRQRSLEEIAASRVVV